MIVQIMALKRPRSMCVPNTMTCHKHLQVSKSLQNSIWHPVHSFIVLQTARQYCTGTQSEKSSRTCCVLTGVLDLRFFEKPAQLSLGRLGLGKVLGSHGKGWTGRSFMDPCTCSLPHRGKCCWPQHACWSETDCHTMTFWFPPKCFSSVTSRSNLRPDRNRQPYSCHT